MLPLPRRPEAAILPSRHPESSPKRNPPAKAQGFPAVKKASTYEVQSESRLTIEERMENANLSQEILRLYKDLSDHILARDGEGANRIYQELLRAGRRDMDRRGVILFA